MRRAVASDIPGIQRVRGSVKENRLVSTTISDEDVRIAIEETVKIAAAERFFVRDPDGNRIEILQWLRPYRPDRDGRFRL